MTRIPRAPIETGIDRTIDMGNDSQANKFMVIVADSDDESSGDIAFFANAQETARQRKQKKSLQ